MILDCNRRPEQGHDAVTANLVYETIVLVDCVHEQLKYGTKDLERLQDRVCRSGPSNREYRQTGR